MRLSRDVLLEEAFEGKAESFCSCVHHPLNILSNSLTSSSCTTNYSIVCEAIDIAIHTRGAYGRRGSWTRRRAGQPLPRSCIASWLSLRIVGMDDLINK